MDTEKASQNSTSCTLPAFLLSHKAVYGVTQTASETSTAYNSNGYLSTSEAAAWAWSTGIEQADRKHHSRAEAPRASPGPGAPITFKILPQPLSHSLQRTLFEHLPSESIPQIH